MSSSDFVISKTKVKGREIEVVKYELWGSNTKVSGDDYTRLAPVKLFLSRLNFANWANIHFALPWS